MPGRRRRRPASTEGHDAGVSPRPPQPMATDGDDVVVDRGARRGRARRPQTMVTDGDDVVVDRGARRGRPRRPQPMATDGDDAVVDRGARRGRPRRPQPMVTDGDDAVDDAVVDRGARRGRARSSSTPAGRRPPRGTTGVCLVLVSHSRWRPTGTTRWCPAEGLARQSRRVHRPHKQTMPPRPPLDGRAG